MKNTFQLIGFVLFLFVTNLSLAQSCSILSLYYDFDSGGEYFAHINVENGEVTILDSITSVNSLGPYGLSGYDPNQNQYICANSSNAINKFLITLNASSGALISEVQITDTSNALELNEILIHPKTGTIYALCWNDIQDSNYLCTLDRASGVLTSLKTIPGSQSVGNALLSSVENQIFYGGSDANFDSYRYIIDLEGNVVSAQPTAPNGSGFGFPAIDQSSGIVYLLGSGNFLSLDPADFTETVIDTLSGMNSVYHHSNVIDEVNSIYMFLGTANSPGPSNKHLFKENIQTGELEIIQLQFGTLNGSVSDFLFPNLNSPYVDVAEASMCEGDSVQLTASVFNGSYLWNTGDTTQSIFVKDSMGYSVQINYPNLCAVHTSDVALNVFDCNSFIDTVFFIGDTCIVDSALVIYAFVNDVQLIDDSLHVMWNFITFLGDTIQQTAQYAVDQNGVFTLAISVSCVGKSQPVIFYDMVEVSGITTGLSKVFQKNKWELYPNPAKDLITVSFVDQAYSGSINLINSTGKIINTFELQNTTSYNIDLSNLQSGMYIVQLKNEDGFSYSKIVKN